LFFLYIIYHAIKIKSTIRFFLLVAITSGIMHYNFISNFWYPWFWFVAALTIFSRHFFDQKIDKMSDVKNV